MISAGQTKVTDISVGRQILCKEKPNTKPTSKCAKKLAKTVKAAKKGLTVKQQKLWRKYVYTSAVLQVKLFCVETSKDPGVCDPYDAGCKLPSKAVLFKRCVKNTLSGKQKFIGLFNTKIEWSDYLVKGAAVIKKFPVNSIVIPGAEDD